MDLLYISGSRRLSNLEKWIRYEFRRRILDCLLFYNNHFFHGRLWRHATQKSNWENILYNNYVFGCNSVRLWNKWIDKSIANVWPVKCKTTRESNNIKSNLSRLLPPPPTVWKCQEVFASAIQAWYRWINPFYRLVATRSQSWRHLLHFWKNF